MQTIHFEDNGQDFLAWDIDQDGTVVDCRPLQGWVWRGKKVLEYAVGQCPLVEIEGMGQQRMIHAVVRIEQINPFYCPKRHTYGACDVQGRLFMVTIFDSHQCAAALEVPGVQKTIIAAIKRRQRALAKENRELR